MNEAVIVFVLRFVKKLYQGHSKVVEFIQFTVFSRDTSVFGKILFSNYNIRFQVFGMW